MRAKSATDKIHGLTISELSACEKISKPNTIHKKIKEMQGQGYIEDGVKAGKAKTYYISTKGLNLLPLQKEEI
jgi:DNA-binding transcriptional regulator GbsR (MarR family)